MAVENGIDLSINLNGFNIKSPIMTASGTYGYAMEYARFLEVPRLGAIVTKAISVEPREGNQWRRLFEVNQGLINSVGLENMGIKSFITYILPMLKANKIDFALNLAGSTKEEYLELAKLAEDNEINCIELNLSCPNVKVGCLEFGTDENTLQELVSEVRNVFSKNIIVKLTPNVTSIEKIAVAAEKAGANAISAINTVKGVGLKLNFKNGNFYKEEVQGGLSGPCIKPIALGAVKRIKSVVNIPVIGIGGIYSLEDIFEFFSVGASAVQIGTANFTHPTIAEDLTNELKEFMKNNGFSSIVELQKALMEAK